MMPPRRKKWTEAEEKTLIDKYGEMVSNGTLAKMKTREKKFKPIACYVNSVHHVRDPVAFPWSWTWKDVSTKVQNMRHQYLLVKQKIKKPLRNAGGPECDDVEEFDWMDGLTHWSNFLRYKEVFGDMGISYGDSMVGTIEGKNDGFFPDCPQMCAMRDGGFVTDVDGGEDGGLGLGFDYDGGEGETNYNNGDDGFVLEGADTNKSGSRKKSSRVWKKRAWGFVMKQLWELRDMEARNEQHQEERDREMQRRENRREELEREWEKKLEEREKEREEVAKSREELSRQRAQEWDAMERESSERERMREHESLDEREWEERMEHRRQDFRKRIDQRLRQHRAEMGQLQARIIHEQQSLTSQVLGLVSQWTGHTTGFSDHSGASNPYLSQVMQNMHHVNGIVHGDAGVDDGNQDDQFIVDG